MRKVEIKIQLNIKFYDTYFFGGGSGAGDIQAYLMKDVYGYPYISGAALKGCIAKYATALSEFYPECDMKERLFGRADMRQGVLFFGNGQLVDREQYQILREYLVQYRTGISIDRDTRSKREGHLFTLEAGSQMGNIEFVSDIQGFLGWKTYKTEVAYLVSAIRLIFALGGRYSAGIGWLEKPIICTVYKDGECVEAEELNQWVGGEICL